jgi:NADPH-dependent 2,4-dienoyl-CoA reductase/sulfur reductase-like enzyme
MKKIIIIGGSDVGIITGLRIRELDKNMDVSIISSNHFPNFSICGIPFYIGGEIKNYKDLAHRTADEIRATGLKLYLDSTVTNVDPVNKQVSFFDSDGKAGLFAYDNLVLGTGAKSIRPDIPGLELPGIFVLRWIDGAIAIDSFIKEKKPIEAVIIGGGYIGLEITEALIRRGIKVKVIEFFDHILTTVDREFGEIVKKVLEEKGAQIFTGRKVEKITNEDGRLQIHATPDLTIAADMAIVAVGVLPETSLAKRMGIETGIKGAITVSRNMETSIQNIYAGGDCTESMHAVTKKPVYIALGSSAHKHGRIIGENICGLKNEYPGTLGTQSIKLFNTVIARTGFNDQEAMEAGFQPLTIDFETWDHKVYYQPAYIIRIRFTADRKTETILGCQIIGSIKAEISKRIDIIAVSIYKGVTVPEFVQLDLSYTPPLSSPWDPVQMAASVWLNKKKTV